MSRTAFSQSFDKELDVKQLLKLRGVTATLDQEDYGLTPAEREWMRRDLLCPSCRCGGASVVRSDVAKPGARNTRQAHFRFIDSLGLTAHRLGCDFYALDDAPGVQRGVDVEFTASDKDTQLVRELVCKAISIGELKKSDIFELRSWFLDLRGSNTFVVSGTSAMADWLWAVHRSGVYGAIKFEPFHVGLPGFIARRAAYRDLAFHYRDYTTQFPRVPFDAEARERVKRIVSAKQGQKLIAMEPLRPQFEATAQLAHLMAEFGDLPFTKKRVIGGVWGDTPEALLALSAALLFVSNWDVNAALVRFSRILAAPTPADLTLGNVMGLNPFHDFAALEVARFMTGLPAASERMYDFDAEMAAVLAKIEDAKAGYANKEMAEFSSAVLWVACAFGTTTIGC